LVGNLLHVDDLPDDLRARILDHGEGNPFYVEEILRSLIDGSVVVPDDASDRWRATRDVDDIPIPDTLHGVLSARIDRLPGEAKRVLQLASVVGRIFTYPVLAAIVEGCSPLPLGRGVGGEGERALDTHLLPHLVVLERAQLIRARARLPEREYAFKHVLTEEAAYSSLLRRERRAVHGQVAEALERLYPERVEEQLGLLAHHWEGAGERDRAVACLRRAGERATAQYANEEAVSYFSRALALIPAAEMAERYSLLLAREGVHDLCGNREAQQRDLAALEAIIATLDNDQRSAEVALRQANYALLVEHNHAAVVAAARRAIRHARLAGDAASEAEGYLLQGKTYHGRRQGPETSREPMLSQALELARKARCGALEADCLRELGLWSSTQGDSAATLSYYEQSLHVYQEIGDRVGMGRALNTIGLVYREMNNFAAARQYCEQGLQLCRETGNRRDEAYALHHLGTACFWQHDYGAARTYLERSLPIFRDVRENYESSALGWLGWLSDSLGDYVQAQAYCEQALDMNPQSPVNWNGLGMVYHHLGENEAARERFQRALGLVQSRDYRTLQAWTLTFLGHALAGLGRLDEAADAYRQALSLRREMDSQTYTMESLAGLARVALAQEEAGDALNHVKEILVYLETHPGLEGTIEPIRVYLTCYQVLRANEDPRAEEVLERGHHLLQEIARKIDDEALRRSYLENVTAHRAH
jgi:predicted ATPase